ncbi:MAG: polysaccharide ABC transporter ATP-binding protein [Legionellaceae bacterium]|nr:polysaccharide ABC transporter ATP-binding protein [Legionellaceae bacterium]
MNAPFRHIKKIKKGLSQEEHFWALKDINFEVQAGDVIGIIGRNGAGKSTLLKVLSRITEPTQGKIGIRGRVASLLEVGTGFHPELTGRENIYLNGSILGMRKAEINGKFDEIIEFAEIEKFLDTPVKRYSSGMYVRLAFAVAAHLDPEILIVDEVLAVGDVHFQKKCLGKMEKFGKEGRTILLVSHNTAVITTLCSKSILLDKGQITSEGDAHEVVRKYSCMLQEFGGQVVWDDPSTAPGTKRVRLHAFRIISENTITSEVWSDKEVRIEVCFWNFEEGAMLRTSIHILDSLGSCIFATGNADLTEDKWINRPYPVGLYRSICVIPANFLNDTTYLVHAFVTRNIGSVEVGTNEPLQFSVLDSGTMRNGFTGHWRGIIRPKMVWETELLSAKPVSEV